MNDNLKLFHDLPFLTTPMFFLAIFFLGIFLGAYLFKKMGVRPTGALEAVLDQTERGLLEQERDGFFNISLDILCIASMEGFFTRVNPSFESTLGFSMQELLTKPFMSFVHPDDVEQTVKVVQKLADGLPTVNFENRYRCKDGTYRWINWTAVPSGKVIYCVGRDTTESKHTHELLTVASKMTALGEMAGGVAHEINNPLQTIYGNASLLRKVLTRTPLDLKKVNSLAEDMESMTLRISKIVKGLRVFAREGSEDPFEVVELETVIEDTLSFCREKFIVHNVKLLSSEIPPHLRLKCLPNQISQILLNLMNNAYQATEALQDKWVRIDVKDVGDSVEISVTDSGKGISNETQRKIFQPFFTTKPIGKGTGLGLSISKGLAENNHGTLGLDSRCEHTRFVIKLPKYFEKEREIV